MSDPSTLDCYQRLVKLAEKLWQMRPLSELARCYEEPGILPKEEDGTNQETE